MIAALVPSVILVALKKWKWCDIGFLKFDFASCKAALFFIPVVTIFVPAAIQGFNIQSTAYVLGNIFLIFFVGLAEEL